MKFSEMIKVLNSDGSRLFKEAKVKEFGKANPRFVMLLKRTYSSEYVYGVKKFDAPKKFGEKSLSDVWSELEVLLDRLVNREIRGDAAKNSITEFASQLSKEEFDVLVTLFKGDLRCGVNASTVNKCFPNTIPEYPYMRCSLMKGSNIDKFNWANGIYSQEKADGMYANVFVYGDGKFKIASRNGTNFPVSQFKNIVEEIEARSVSDICLQGELLVKRDGKILPREIGNGILNSVLKGGDFENGDAPVFMVWDAVPVSKAVAGGKYDLSYQYRFAALEAMFNINVPIEPIISKLVCSLEEALEHYDVPIEPIISKLVYALEEAFEHFDVPIKPITSKIVYSLEEAFEHYVEMTSKGFEGTVLKNPEGIWADGTSKDQIKMKVEAEVDLLVVGWNKGNGKNEKWFGSLRCESADGKVQVNVSGFSDAERERIFNEMDEWVGKKIITVRANSLMSAKDGQPARLFLPRMVEERLDKTEADTLEKIQQIFTEVMNGK
jgi:DNA ligase-1